MTPYITHLVQLDAVFSKLLSNEHNMHHMVMIGYGMLWLNQPHTHTSQKENTLKKRNMSWRIGAEQKTWVLPFCRRCVWAAAAPLKPASAAHDHPQPLHEATLGAQHGGGHLLRVLLRWRTAVRRCPLRRRGGRRRSLFGRAKMVLDGMAISGWYGLDTPVRGGCQI